ncbi:seipin-2 [Morus notabilis]|uniref:seipin-2 n=1 Tax=Morus notabilis TaxID=981085 RepID=UPI000CED4213|nr:seipin-2 [Morus notabilis]
MDESKIHENGHIGNVELVFQQTSEEILLGFDPTSCEKSRNLFYVLKCSMVKLLLGGADKVIKDQRALKTKLPDLAKGLELHDLRSSLPEKERVYEKSGNSTFLNSSADYEHPLQVENFPTRDHNNLSLINFLAFVMSLVVKIMGFQFSLLISFLTFPIWSSYVLFMFLLFPLQTLDQVRGYFMKKVLGMSGGTCMLFTSSVSKRVNAQKSKAVRIGWALFSSIYVCSVLLGLLAFGFFLGGFVMKHLVEKPIQTRENLNFDYSKASPVAFVPLKDNVGHETRSSARVIPYNHKLQLAVSLTVPDSEYNQKLGVFQVRVDFLAANGNVIASAGHPCMLRYKSHPIRIVETVLKSAPLIAGFQSESQLLNIKMTEFTEGIEPTACMRIILEQRAEYLPGEGIPQIYAASLLLESELPKLKRLVWPVIVPRPRSGYGKKNARGKVKS